MRPFSLGTQWGLHCKNTGKFTSMTPVSWHLAHTEGQRGYGIKCSCHNIVQSWIQMRPVESFTIVVYVNAYIHTHTHTFCTQAHKNTQHTQKPDKTNIYWLKTRIYTYLYIYIYIYIYIYHIHIEEVLTIIVTCFSWRDPADVGGTSEFDSLRRLEEPLQPSSS